MANKVEIQIVGNNVYAVNAIDKTKQKLGTLQKSAESSSNALLRMGKSLAAGFSVYAVGNFLSDSIQKFKEQEIAVKKLDTAFGRNTTRLQEYASELQNVTVYGDETTISAMSLLAAFVKDEEQIKKLTKATMDLATAKGMDLVAAADLVAKSVGSSTNALSRYGIQVTGAVGSTERLNTAVENIAKLYGGQATEEGKTLAGQLEIVKNQLGDQQEIIGARVLPAWLLLNKAFAWTTTQLYEMGRMFRAGGAAQYFYEKLVEEKKAIDALMMSPHQQPRLELMKTYKELTEEQKKALELAKKQREEELKKLEAIRRQNEEYQHQLNKATRNLEPRGMQDVGGGVELEMAEEIAVRRMELSNEVTALEIANHFLVSEAAEFSFGNMAQAMLNFYNVSGNAAKGAFAAYKGFAIAETLAATFAASMKIFEAYAVVPWYAYPQAAAVIALGLSRVAQIAALQPGSSGGGGGGGYSAPSLPSGGVTNNQNDNRRNYIVNITINGSSGNWEGDKDRIARDLIYYIDKARGDGG